MKSLAPLKPFFVSVWAFWPSLFLLSQGPPADSLAAFFEKTEARQLLIFANNNAQDRPDLARAAFETAFEKAEKAQNQPLLFAVRRDHGLFFEDRNQLDSAILLYQKALDEARKMGSSVDQLTVLNDLAIVARKQSKYRKSKKYHLEALELAQKTGDDETVEFSFHGLGFLYEKVEEHGQALFYYEKSLEAAVRRGSKSGQAITLQNLGHIYARLGDSKKALTSIAQALDLAEKSRDTLEWSNAFSSLGEVFELLAEDQKALEPFSKSEKMHLARRDFSSAATAMTNRARIFSKQKKHEKAVELYQKCLGWQSVLPVDQVAEIQWLLGQSLQKSGRGDLAEAHFLKSFETASRYRMSERAIQSARSLHAILTEKGRSPEALFYLKKATTMLDSLAAQKAADGAEALEFRYDQEINQREFDELKIREGRFWIIAVSILGLGLAVSLAFWLRLKRRANARLQEKMAEIQDQNVRLTESNTFLQQFTYAVAHDLKAPLRTVGSFIQILDQRFGAQFPTEAHQYMNFVTTGVRRMDLLIRDLLEYSKISAQRPSGEISDAKTAFEEAVGRLAEQIEAQKALVETAGELPKMPIDASHLAVLMQNLISNGLKFNRSERPVVRVAGASETERVLFSVDDNGIGIDPGHAKKVFELFHQLNKNKGFEGTGIGLTICRNIVDKYDGKIWFEPSEALGGTRFCVSFPSKK